MYHYTITIKEQHVIFTHFHVVPNPNKFLSSDEHKKEAFGTHNEQKGYIAFVIILWCFVLFYFFILRCNCQMNND